MNTNKNFTYVREKKFLHDLEKLKIKLFVFDKESIFIANQFFSDVIVRKPRKSIVSFSTASYRERKYFAQGLKSNYKRKDPG